jgi:hypothetical protein
MIETALFTHLSTAAGMVALVGTRIYPVTLPQQPTLPAVVYQMISSAPIQDRSAMAAGFTRSRFQFTVWASSDTSAAAVMAALRVAIGTFADVALEQGARMEYEPDTTRWQGMLDYFIWHTQ